MGERIEMPYFSLGFYTLEETVEMLQDEKDHPTFKYYCDFLGHRLYADTVTVDDAYLEVYGITREEYKKQLKKSYDEYMRRTTEFFKKQRLESEERKRQLYDRAKGMIPEEKIELFDKAYSILISKNLFNHDNHNAFLDLIAYLNQDDCTLEEAVIMFKQIKTHHEPQDSMLLKIIKALSSHGSLLFNELYDENREKQAIEAQERFAEYYKNLTSLNRESRPEHMVVGNHDFKVESQETRVVDPAIEKIINRAMNKMNRPKDEMALNEYERRITMFNIIGYDRKKEAQGGPKKG